MGTDAKLRTTYEIYNDLDTDNPHFDYDTSELNGTKEPMDLLIKSRKRGKATFDSTIRKIEKQSPDLYRRITQASKEPSNESKSTASLDIPALPQEVVKIQKLAKSTFFDEYERYSQQRSPRGYKDYHTACACFTLSIIAGRRVYVQHAGIEFYTPMMIALIGRSTYTAKTKTARVSTDILRYAGLNWLLGPDETTPQKMLSAMAGHLPSNWSDLSEEKQETTKKRLAMAGQRGWFYDEFGQLLQSIMQVNSPMSDFAGLLRRMDECMDTYTYDTRSFGEETIEKPYLSLLATLTPSDVEQQAKKRASFWNNGFWARFLIVTPPANEYGGGYSPDDIEIPDELVKMLIDWHYRLGMPQVEVTQDEERKKYTINKKGDLKSHRVTFTKEALEASRKYERAVLETNKENGIQDLDSSIGRLMDKAIRVATLIASLENDDIIDLPQWAKGQEIAEMARRNLYELYYQVNETTDESQEHEDILINWLEAQKDLKEFTIRQLAQSAPNRLRKLGSSGIETIVNKLLRTSDLIMPVQKPGKKAKYYQYVAAGEKCSNLPSSVATSVAS